jgi:hypothetical protein
VVLFKGSDYRNVFEELVPEVLIVANGKAVIETKYLHRTLFGDPFLISVGVDVQVQVSLTELSR